MTFQQTHTDQDGDRRGTDETSNYLMAHKALRVRYSILPSWKSFSNTSLRFFELYALTLLNLQFERDGYQQAKLYKKIDSRISFPYVLHKF